MGALAIRRAPVTFPILAAPTLLASELGRRNRECPPAAPSNPARAREGPARDHCCTPATGAAAIGGKWQFGSTFRLCFSEIAWISQRYGSVLPGGGVRRVLMTRTSFQVLWGDNPRRNKVAAATRTGDTINDYLAPAYRASDGRLACRTRICWHGSRRSALSGPCAS